jgi:hypothetical protein
MGLSAEYLELRQPIPTQSPLDIRNANLSYESDTWKPDPLKDHPLMINIRNTVTKYRLQSAAHFDVVINVKQAFHVKGREVTLRTKVNVVFGNWEYEECCICRPVFRKHARKKTQFLTNEVEVYSTETGNAIALSKFLQVAFPCYHDEVGTGQMQAWWAANGKVFDWTGLPTELKEKIIQCCLHQPLESGDHKQMRSRYQDRFRPRRGRREFGIYEIVDKLTVWAPLLGVSHQIRAITLRSCFKGSSGITYHGGFTVAASSCHSLESTLRRLDRYYQMTDTNSLPINDTTQILAHCYRQYPQIYPQLEHYATFRHGIRNICLTMDFIAYMHFFRVTTGNFRKYLRPGSISFEILEQLPHLTGIAIWLPRQPQQGWLDDPWQPGPRLFYDNFPCPRMLHRVIYERIAELLTAYPQVKVNGFVDADEKLRYKALRKIAIAERKWSTADLDELYADCGGGIELDEPLRPGCWLLDKEREEEQKETVKSFEHIWEATDDFFPPKCRCEEKCLLVFNEKEKKRRYYVGPIRSCGSALDNL